MDELTPLGHDGPHDRAVVGLPRHEAELRSELERAAELLIRADQEIALVSRALPVEPKLGNAQRTRAASAEGRRGLLARLDLGATRRLLVRLARLTEPFGLLGRLHAERALELELEARIVEHFGRPELGALAAERFPVPTGASARACDAFIAAALGAPGEPARSLHRSDDASDPGSLCSVLSRRSRELGLTIRVEVRPGQLATAATGDGIVAVRPGVMLSRAATDRIALHELLGHALPRARARHAPLRLFRAGTARSADCEEGRALLVERRAGLFDAERRRELALRHRAALAVRDHADPSETVALLKQLGASVECALEIARRAHRGGGLAREIVYLPWYFEVVEALGQRPALEPWLERGRLDLGAARLFADGALRLGEAR